MLEIKSHEDFDKLREQLQKWRKRFPMFSHDVRRIQDSIDIHMKHYMDYLIKYKQSKKGQELVMSKNSKFIRF